MKIQDFLVESVKDAKNWVSFLYLDNKKMKLGIRFLKPQTKINDVQGTLPENVLSLLNGENYLVFQATDKVSAIKMAKLRLRMDINKLKNVHADSTEETEENEK